MKKNLIIRILLCTALITYTITSVIPAPKTTAATKYMLANYGWRWSFYSKSKLYMKPNKIIIKGKFRKCTKDPDKIKGKIIKYKSKSIRVAQNCKIKYCEDKVYTYAYKKYLTKHDISPYKSTISACTTITIKNGKVTEIVLSA